MSSKDEYEHPNKLAIAIGTKVREAREEAGLSQAELAKFIQVRRPTITNIENGKSEPTISTLLMIATALEKPIEFFLTHVPRAWRVPESSLSPDERLMLIKLRDIQEPRDVALAIAILDTIAKFEISEFRAAVRKDREENKEADEQFEKLWDHVWDALEKGELPGLLTEDEENTSATTR